jgi:mRNA interferase MazF
VVVAALTRTRRGLVSELLLTTGEDGVPTDGVVNFDKLHALPRSAFHRRVTSSARRMRQVCRALRGALGF